MAKQNKLRLPIWEQVIYLLLLIGGPVSTIYAAAIVHNPDGKYISYLTVFVMGLIAFVIINNVLIKPWKVKVKAQIGTLELNYQTKVGSAEDTKQMWKAQNFKMFLWDGGFTLFIAFAIWYLLSGMTSWIEHIGKYLTIMFAFILAALIFRAFCFIGNPFKKDTDKTE